MKKNRTALLPTFFAGLISVTPLVVVAQGLESPIEGNLWDFLVNIVVSVQYILFPILVVMLVYTGYLFVAAQGNPGKLTEAKRAFVWTLIGGFVILGAQALSFAVKATIEGLGE